MYRVCGLPLGPKLRAQPAAEKNLYLWSAVEKVHVFLVFTKKYLRLHGRGGTNFMVAAKYKNQMKC